MIEVIDGIIHNTKVTNHFGRRIYVSDKDSLMLAAIASVWKAFNCFTLVIFIHSSSAHYSSNFSCNFYDSNLGLGAADVMIFVLHGEVCLEYYGMSYTEPT